MSSDVLSEVQQTADRVGIIRGGGWLPSTLVLVAIGVVGFRRRDVAT